VLPAWIPIVGLLVLLGAAAGDVLVARRLGPVARRMPATVARGAATSVSIELGSPPPGAQRVRQPAPPDVRIEPEEGDGALHATLTARRRGRHVLPKAAVRTVGPLGLGAVYHRPGAPADLVVFPDMPSGRRLAARARAGRLPEATRRRGAVGLGTEFERIREYSPDDDVRQINWRATARTGRPMSNQYRIDQDRDVLCVVDAGRLMAAPIGNVTLLDLAVDAACAVAATADEMGDRAGVVVFDDRVRRNLAPRRRGAGGVAQALFDVDAAESDSDFRRAFEVFARRKRATVVILTDILDGPAARPLLEGLPVIARRHAVVVATIADPATRAALELEPDAIADVLRASVAATLTQHRRQVISTIASLGVDVVDATSASLSADCVRAYLRAKSRGRA
jgi:uncharacterized protein (DUF58 family)